MGAFACGCSCSTGARIPGARAPGLRRFCAIWDGGELGFGLLAWRCPGCECSCSTEPALRWCAGIGIGSGVALLLAPSSGEEVRHVIGRGYRKTVKSIGRRTEDLRDRAEDLLEHAHDLRERGSRLFHFGRGREAARREA